MPARPLFLGRLHAPDGASMPLQLDIGASGRASAHSVAMGPQAAPYPGAQSAPSAPNLQLPAHHLVTHAAVVGMTGSGKTGLVMVLVEEALRSKVPVLMIDIKGDLPNLLLAFPELSA